MRSSTSCSPRSACTATGSGGACGIAGPAGTPCAKASANAGGGSENEPPERQQAMVAGHGVGAPMVDRLDPGGEQPFSSIRAPAPPTRRTSTPTGSRSPGSRASPGAPPAVRRTYSADWDDVLPHVLAESSRKINRPRRDQSYPRGQARPPQLPRPNCQRRSSEDALDTLRPSASCLAHKLSARLPDTRRRPRATRPRADYRPGICCDARTVSAP